MRLTAVSLSLIIVLSGCASSSKVTLVGSETYKCASHGGFFELVGTGALAAEQQCQEQAIEYCGRDGKQAELITAKSKNASMTYVATAEATFRCVSDGEIAQRSEAVAKLVAERDNAVCQSYGFKPGTEGFASCLMTQDQNRLNAAVRSDERSERIYKERIEAERHAGERAVQAAKQVNDSVKHSQPVTVTCNTVGNTTTCQ